jgi:4-hydroxy-3-polyprenylbenzoate decarboxylase
MRKIVVAITGASGSLYASILIEKLLAIRSQWETVSIVMTFHSQTGHVLPAVTFRAQAFRESLFRKVHPS